MKRFFNVGPDGKPVEVSPEEFEALQSKPFGLGDAVATVAQPIARALDAVLGTNVQGCGGCAQRKAALNRLIPKL